MDKYSDFKIKRYKGEYVLYNVKGGRDYHTHLENVGICKFLIKLICKEIVPNNPYLRESAKRVSRNSKYIEKIERI